jgi:hypothetical protein
MYGEMDFTDIENWEFKRTDVIFESLITSGHFADIYLATNQKTGSTVVAKTLKSNVYEIFSKSLYDGEYSFKYNYIIIIIFLYF